MSHVLLCIYLILYIFLFCINLFPLKSSFNIFLVRHLEGMQHLIIIIGFITECHEADIKIKIILCGE